MACTESFGLLSSVCSHANIHLLQRPFLSVTCLPNLGHFFTAGTFGMDPGPELQSLLLSKLLNLLLVHNCCLHLILSTFHPVRTIWSFRLSRAQHSFERTILLGHNDLSLQAIYQQQASFWDCINCTNWLYQLAQSSDLSAQQLQALNLFFQVDGKEDVVILNLAALASAPHLLCHLRNQYKVAEPGYLLKNINAQNRLVVAECLKIRPFIVFFGLEQNSILFTSVYLYRASSRHMLPQGTFQRQVRHIIKSNWFKDFPRLAILLPSPSFPLPLTQPSCYY